MKGYKNKYPIISITKIPHKKTPENKPIKIKTPPIVGVPIFLSMILRSIRPDWISYILKKSN